MLAALVLAWDLVANAVHASLSLPGPWLVVKSTWEDRADLAPAMWTTTEEALLGIALAVVVRADPGDRDRLVARDPRAASTR